MRATQAWEQALMVGVAVQGGDGVLVAARRGAGGLAAEARWQMADGSR
jgi:hypothetical protein